MKRYTKNEAKKLAKRYEKDGYNNVIIEDIKTWRKDEKR